MNWTKKNENRLILVSVIVLLVAIALPLIWLKLPFLGVIGVISLFAVPFLTAIHRSDRRKTYILLAMLGLAALCGLLITINEWSRVSTFEDACDKFNGSLLIEDFQYLCLNENHETSVLSIDMLSGPINNVSIVLYAGVFLLFAPYSFYLLLHFLYKMLVKYRR